MKPYSSNKKVGVVNILPHNREEVYSCSNFAHWYTSLQTLHKFSFVNSGIERWNCEEFDGYRKGRNIGDTFNLAVWRWANKSPNLKPPTFLCTHNLMIGSLAITLRCVWNTRSSSCKIVSSWKMAVATQVFGEKERRPWYPAVSPHYACYFHLHSNSRSLLYTYTYTSLGITFTHDVSRLAMTKTAKFKFANILVSRFSDKIAKFFCPPIFWRLRYLTPLEQGTVSLEY